MIFVCASCGFGNSVDFEAEHRPAAPMQAVADVVPSTTSKEVAVDDWIHSEALQRLRPIPWDGERCRKCAHPVHDLQGYCERCGLGVQESLRYGPKEAPWEQAPAGQEERFEQSELLWSAFDASQSSQDLKKYVDFCIAEDFLEVAIRRLRFYLVDHPEDSVALASLNELGSRFQSRIIVAQAQAKVSAENFTDDIRKYRTLLVGFNVVFWLIILAIVAMVASRHCS